MSERDYFLKARTEFWQKLRFVPWILNRIRATQLNPRQAWANDLFFRLGMIGNSLMLLCGADLIDDPPDKRVLDHNSIASLSRNLLDAWLMFMYSSSPGLSEEEWLLGKAVFDLHESVACYRTSKLLGDVEGAENFHVKMDALKKRIQIDVMFQNLDDAKYQNRLLSGQALYICGRNAVVRDAGWNVEHFDAVYVILSNHAHSHPQSFRLNVDRPDADDAFSELQFKTSGMALEYVTEPLSAACVRMGQLYPEIIPTTGAKH